MEVNLFGFHLTHFRLQRIWVEGECLRHDGGGFNEVIRAMLRKTMFSIAF
jgi:hypothetical protein